MTEQKKKAETARLRNRIDIVIRELHEKYPSTDGWRIVSVNSNIIQLDVVLERSTAQATKEVVKDVVEKEVKEQEVSKEQVVSKETPTEVSTNQSTTTPKTTKRSSKANTKGV